MLERALFSNRNWFLTIEDAKHKKKRKNKHQTQKNKKQESTKRFNPKLFQQNVPNKVVTFTDYLVTFRVCVFFPFERTE